MLEPRPDPDSLPPPPSATDPAPSPAVDQPAGPETVPLAVPVAVPVGVPTGLPPSPRDRARRWGAGVLVALLIVVAFATGAAVDRTGLLPGSPAVAATPGPSGGAGDDPDLALIAQAWKAILDNYVDSANLDHRALAYGAIKGLAEAVGDEGHTQFMTADEARAVDQSLSGTFVGIGVQVAEDDSRFVVGDVIPDTPAEEAGIRRGDEIVEVDGTPTKGKTIDEVVSMVRGPEGETVTLGISRSGVAAPFDVRITRRKFDLPVVEWAMIPGTTAALIRLEQFSTGATDALKDAIRKAREAGATGIVFDLRGNPGGYVNEAVGVASQFVPDGVVYRSVDRSGKEQDADVEPGGLATDIPLVVLADGTTASAAEIVSGAIQDAGRAKVVGERTFGTGTVLGRFDLADGSSLRIGVERWLTRDGRPIWHEGLAPDVEVPLPDSAQRLRPSDVRGMDAARFRASQDAQLLRAVELLRAAS